MPTKMCVERTAKSGFTLAGQPVGKGQVVSLDPFQLNELAAKGCVALSDQENARVARAELPPFVLPDVPELIEARRLAAEEINTVQRSVVDARTKAADEIAGIERTTTERLQALGREVAEAEKTRVARLQDIEAEIASAQAAARERIAAPEATAQEAVERSADDAPTERKRRQPAA